MHCKIEALSKLCYGVSVIPCVECNGKAISRMLNRGDPTSEYSNRVRQFSPEIAISRHLPLIPAPPILKIQNYSGSPTRCDARSSPLPSINLAWTGMTSAGGPCKSNIPSPRACSCTDSGIHKVMQDCTPFQEVVPHFCFRHLDFLLFLCTP